MPFSFNPGQQGGQQTQQVASEAPPLIVPDAPVISTAPVVEAISPFAFRNRHKSNFGVYFQFVIFAISGVMILATVGLFAYQRVLIAQIDSRKQELDDKQAAFPKIDVDNMQKMSGRIKIINKVINERASVNTAFKLLETEILDNTVTFTKFTLDKNRLGKGYDLSFTGEASSYPALYQQIAALNNKKLSRYFSKIVISGTGPLDKKGIGYFRADTIVSLEGIDSDTFTIDTNSDTGSSTNAASPTASSTASGPVTSTASTTP